MTAMARNRVDGDVDPELRPAVDLPARVLMMEVTLRPQRPDRP